MRLMLRAPKFCAEKVVTEEPIASEIIHTKQVILQLKPHAAMAFAPKLLILV